MRRGKDRAAREEARQAGSGLVRAEAAGALSRTAAEGKRGVSAGLGGSSVRAQCGEYGRACECPDWSGGREDGRMVGRVESGFEREQRTPVEGTVSSGGRADSGNSGNEYQVRATS